jgi:hypothetical protein
MPRGSTAEQEMDEILDAAEDGTLDREMAAKAMHLYGDMLAKGDYEPPKGTKRRKRTEANPDGDETDESPPFSNTEEGEDYEDEDANSATTDMPKMRMSRGSKPSSGRSRAEAPRTGFGKSYQADDDDDLDLDPDFVRKSLIESGNDGVYDAVPFVRDTCDQISQLTKSVNAQRRDQAETKNLMRLLTKSVNRLHTYLKSIAEDGDEDENEGVVDEPTANDTPVADAAMKSMLKTALDGIAELRGRADSMEMAVNNTPVSPHANGNREAARKSVQRQGGTVAERHPEGVYQRREGREARLRVRLEGSPRHSQGHRRRRRPPRSHPA